MTVYVDLTREFNAGRTRAVICSGQACVLHRLAIASKDGDWILREDEEALGHVLSVLAHIGKDRRVLAEALQSEQLDIMELDERRLAAYRAASRGLTEAWTDLSRTFDGLPLSAAHAMLIQHVERRLPTRVEVAQ